MNTEQSVQKGFVVFFVVLLVGVATAFPHLAFAAGNACDTDAGCATGQEECKGDSSPGDGTSSGVCVVVKCTTDPGECNQNVTSSEVGWGGARCVGLNPAKGDNVGRCVEAPASSRGLPQEDGVPTEGNEVIDRIGLIGNWVFAIFLAISIIYIILGAFQFVTGGGDPTQISGARQKLIYAAVGIAIALLAAGFDDILRSIIVGA